MSNEIREAVQAKYGALAASGLSSDHSGVNAVAEAFGYSPEELAAIPAEANMGLSCGNPTALASLRPAKSWSILVCGGGLDVFLAAAGWPRRQGHRHRHDARNDRACSQERGEGRRSTNVEFHLATIDQLPLPDASVDCVISNCVINLAPDKRAVFREIARVLKPGGRVAVSDIALKQPLPADLRRDLMAYVGCIAGAITIDDYRQGLLAGPDSRMSRCLDSGSDLNAYAKLENQACCCGPATNSGPARLGQNANAPQRRSPQRTCTPGLPTCFAGTMSTNTPPACACSRSNRAGNLRTDQGQGREGRRVMAVAAPFARGSTSERSRPSCGCQNGSGWLAADPG